MEQRTEMRRPVLVEGIGRRQLLRETGMYWRTVPKSLQHGEPPGCRMERPRREPKLRPCRERIGRFSKEARALPREQRPTAKRIFELLLTR